MLRKATDGGTLYLGTLEPNQNKKAPNPANPPVNQNLKYKETAKHNRLKPHKPPLGSAAETNGAGI